jgi:transcription termination/antitermination protein NusG
MKKKASQNWYVLQVITGKEAKIEKMVSLLDLASLSAFLPRKILKIRKKGIVTDAATPLYPGYLFVVGTWDINEAKKIVNITDAVKFVGGNSSPGFLREEEKELIQKIVKDGVAGYSKVVKEGTKIKVVSGPLKELKGVIESVDRRKRRAVVKLPLLNSTIKVTLGFEYIDEMSE